MNRIARHLISLAAMAGAAVASNLATAQTASPKDALKAATEKANAIQAATGTKQVAKQAAKPLPPGDPCTALPLAAVQGVFPGTKAGERSARLDQYGITECRWKSAAGELLLVLQETRDHGKSAKDDALGMAQGFTDPKALKNVRIETFPSLGVDNAAFVEGADARRGILNDGAYLELRKGEHNLSINAPGLAGRDRAQALKAFETLGRLAASRL
ncbi:MAG: hypothetical protein ABI277_11650 [Burkholderiaceae bacterium]